MKTVLVTGGAGYIGTHTVVLLQQAGIPVVVLDNLDNSHAAALQRVQQITGQPVPFVQADIRDSGALDSLFSDHDIGAVIHFAGLKAVGESVAQPLRYYDNNVVGTLRLLQAMDRAGVRTLVFSSSATVYGDPQTVPITEDAPLAATNPYGATKLHIEGMLRDLYRADQRWQLALLRYFNPVGAHASGLIGEDPSGEPNNLMPYIAQVAVGKRARLKVFGSDYATADGTGVRDYIHVMDLAQGHLDALDALQAQDGLITVNLGTGRGYSVLEVVHAFAAASGHDIPHDIVARRPGDAASCYADPARARQLLGWQAQYGLATMCADHWRWQRDNPDGYCVPEPSPPQTAD